MDNDKYYEILGLKNNANQIEIHDAYNNLVRIHHPDKGGSNDEMAKLNEAYMALFDKKKYDELKSKKQLDVQTENTSNSSHHSSSDSNNEDDSKNSSSSKFKNGLIVCSKCGTVNFAEDNFCINCGVSITSSIPSDGVVCPSCGVICNKNSNFCDNCGFSFVDASEDMIFCPYCGAVCNKKDAFCDACCYSLDDSQVNDNELDMITNLFKKILTVPINNGFQSRLSLFKFFSFSFIGFTIIVEFYYSLMYNGFDMLFFVYSLCMYILFIMSGYFLREFKKYVFQDHKSSLKNYSLSFDDFMTKFFDKIAGFPIQNNSEIKISKFKFIGFLIFGIILAFVYYMSFNNYYLSDYISWIFHNFYLIDQISWIIYGIFFYIVFWILSKISD